MVATKASVGLLLYLGMLTESSVGYAVVTKLGVMVTALPGIVNVAVLSVYQPPVTGIL